MGALEAARAADIRAAAYCRFSRDDARQGEHESIANQRKLIARCAEDMGILLQDEYIDDGWSGTSFERPDWQRLMRDIESGRINTLIIKDLSRLGRNYAQAGYFTDTYFAEHGVRLIAVADNVDTGKQDYDDLMPFRHVINDAFARDISKKVRSSYRSKFREGSFISGFAPYGYQKDPKDKNHLIVDSETAPVVQRIYEMAADNISPYKIANHLNDSGILSPLAYRFSKNPQYNPQKYVWRGEVRALRWSGPAIIKMLKNEVYLGDMAQGKRRKVSYSSKKVVALPQSEWVTVKDTHAAIIPPALFQTVQKRCVSRRIPKTTGFRNVFAGIAKCADCGSNLSCGGGVSSDKYCLSCSRYRNKGVQACSSHRIRFQALYDAVFADLKQVLFITDDERRKILQQCESRHRVREERQEPTDGLGQLQRREHELDRIIEKLYDDLLSGKIDQARMERLLEKFQTEQRDISSKRSMILEKQDTETQQSGTTNTFAALLDELTDFDALTADLLRRFVERIEVFEISNPGAKQKRFKVRIHYKFLGSMGNRDA